MNRITLEEVYKVFFMAFFVNLAFALFLYPWVTKNDISELPDNPIDKLLTLFTFGLATFTTSGFVNTNAISRRLKIVSSLYVILVISGAVSFLFTF